MSSEKQIPVPLPRKLLFTKQVDQESISQLTREILDINEHDAHLKKIYKAHNLDYIPNPIEIYIDSYGGYVYQIFGLISIIDSSKTPIHTIVTGCAMSCGFMLLISGHKRFAHKLSTILYHSVSNVHYGQVQTLKEDLKETTRLQKELENITLTRTKISKKKMQDIKKRKFDWFITAKEASKLGIVDKIIK